MKPNQYPFIELPKNLAIKADPLQWMLCKRNGKRWIPFAFYINDKDLMRALIERYLKGSGARSIEELKESIDRGVAELTHVFQQAGITRQITGGEK